MRGASPSTRRRVEKGAGCTRAARSVPPAFGRASIAGAPSTEAAPAPGSLHGDDPDEAEVVDRSRRREGRHSQPPPERPALGRAVMDEALRIRGRRQSQILRHREGHVVVREPIRNDQHRQVRTKDRERRTGVRLPRSAIRACAELTTLACGRRMSPLRFTTEAPSGIDDVSTTGASRAAGAAPSAGPAREAGAAPSGSANCAKSTVDGAPNSSIRIAYPVAARR